MNRRPSGDFHHHVLGEIVELRHAGDLRVINPPYEEHVQYKTGSRLICEQGTVDVDASVSASVRIPMGSVY